MSRYQVIVGNLGTIYDGEDEDQALDKFNGYCALARSQYGRVSGEPVTLLCNDTIVSEQLGRE